MLELLRRRRSVRFFEPTPVAPEDIDLLIEAVLRAPTSRGFQPWEFIVVTEPDMLEKLAKSKGHGSAFLSRVPLAFVIAAEKSKSDVWVEDCSIAAIILQLSAESLGLGSCWAQIRKRPHDASKSAETYVREVVGLPESFAVECIIGVGHPGEDKIPHPADSLLHNQVHFENYVPD